ncbi:MAG: hypothetical protein FGM24_04765 [Candidatus Kapabacteria bacterium]|nr:hypothetical protein [Candidatus Kapabacteria bacterium]
MLNTLMVCIVGVLCVSTVHAQLTPPVLVGYWHNWNDANARYIDIDSVDDRYNVVTVAFALPVSNTDMTMTFVPDRGTKQQLKQRIQRLQDNGTKVLISVGGATAYVDLTTVANRDAFVTSMKTILVDYGFDGMDVDIEHGRSILIEGGTVAAPQNIAQTHLIEAIRTIMAEYRTTFSRKMVLTFAPETAYVQGGMSGFGNIWGGYLPILDALRDSIDLLHVQLYNSGTMYGIDNKIYAQGTVDFIVAMTEAVIKGFDTRGGGRFAGFPASKVAVGLPSTTNAAGGGYVDSAQIDSAVTYLLHGGTKPGTYTLRDSSGYSDLAGMMTWSINWDSVGANNRSYPYAATYEALFGPPPIPTPDQVALIAPFQDQFLTENRTLLRWYRANPAVDAYHVEVRDGARVIVSDTTVRDTTFSMAILTPASTYTWRVRARNVSGWGSWSTQRTFRSVPYPGVVVMLEPTNRVTLAQNESRLVWGKAVPGVLEYRLQMLDAKGAMVTDSLLTDTSLHVVLKPASTYSWRVQARNVSGWGPWSDLWTFSSVPYPDTVRLTAPDNQVVIPADSVELHWHKGTSGIVAFQLEVYNDSKLIYSDTAVADTSILLRSLACCSMHAWRVRARNVSGWGPWSKPWQFESLPPPSVVDIVSPAANATVHVDSIVVSWNAATPKVLAYRMEIYRDTAMLYSDSTITELQRRLDMLEVDKMYSIRMQAGNASGWGPWSAMRSFTVVRTQTSSVADNVLRNGLTLYPNPVYDVLTVHRRSQSRTRFALYDMRGTEVIDVMVEHGQHILRLDCSGLPSGLYVLRSDDAAMLVVKAK